MSRLITIAVATLCLVCAGVPPVVAESVSLWHHNGSLFTLSPDGTRLILRYHEPREGMRVEGVTRGTILFDVERSGNFLSGTAYVFSRRCGSIPYRVTGEMLPDARRMSLKGNPPTALDMRCNATAVRNDAAQFDLRQGIFPPAPSSERQLPSAVEPASPSATPGPAVAERLKKLLDRTADPRTDPIGSIDGDGFAHTWRPDPAVMARLEQFEREQHNRQEQQAAMSVTAPTMAQRPIAQPELRPPSATEFFNINNALFWTAVTSALAGALALIVVASCWVGQRSRQSRHPLLKWKA